MEDTRATFPSQSWPVFGHTWAVELLKQSCGHADPTGTAREGGPSHAYLFVGPRRVGKTTLARVFARTLLCLAPERSPCGSCRSCKLLAHDSHPDFVLIQPLDKDGNADRFNGELRTEQAVTLIRDAALRPVEGPYRIFLLQDMDRANASFANKILKTLEEPPSHSILLLTATERQAVLPTIASRCQVLELRPLDQGVVAEALQTGWSVDAEQASLLARLSNGSLGWAVDQLHHPEQWRSRQTDLEELWHLTTADRIERLSYAEALAGNQQSPRLFGLLELWTSWWRDVLMAQAGCIDACSNIDCRSQIERYAQAVSSAQVGDFLRTLRRIEAYLHHTVNRKLALDVLVLRLPYVDVD